MLALSTPIGMLCIEGDEKGIRRVCFDRGANDRPTPMEQLAAQELSAYFDGTRRAFTVSLALNGTDFQKKVWNALRLVPYGATASYGQIAKSIGDPTAARAAGAACRANPALILIPCHRILRSDGSLSGYAGGTDRKLALLRLEGCADHIPARRNA